MHNSSFLFSFKMMFFFIPYWNKTIFFILDDSLSGRQWCVSDCKKNTGKFQLRICHDFDKFVMCHRHPARIRGRSPETRRRTESESESPKRSSLSQTGAEFRERAAHLLRTQPGNRWTLLRRLHHQHRKGLKFNLKAWCHTRFQRAFAACCCVFKAQTDAIN